MENFRVVEAIISTELEEKNRAKGQSESIHALNVNVQKLLQNYIHEFIELAPNESFKEKLRNIAKELVATL
jgi:hypothetical protein